MENQLSDGEYIVEWSGYTQPIFSNLRKYDSILPQAELSCPDGGVMVRRPDVDRPGRTCYDVMYKDIAIARVVHTWDIANPEADTNDEQEVAIDGIVNWTRDGDEKFGWINYTHSTGATFHISTN